MHRIYRRLALLTGIAVIAAVLLATVGAPPRQADADIPHAGLQFSISVTGLSGCTTASGDTTCTIQSGAPFQVDIGLDALGGIPSYDGMDLILNYSGVSAQEGTADVTRWPDCGFQASRYLEGIVAMACATGLPPAGPSTYTGVVGSTAFTCGQSGEVSLVHGDGNTDLVETTAAIHAESQGGSEKLTIECTSGGTVPPTPSGPGGPTNAERTATAEAGGPTAPFDDETPQGTAPQETPSETDGTGTPRPTSTPGDSENAGDDDGGGLPVWAWIVIGVGAAGGAGGLGYAGWRYYQQRQSTGA